MGRKADSTIRQVHQWQKVRDPLLLMCCRTGGSPSTDSLDSPAAYVAGLGRLFAHTQLLDEHSKALLSQPVAPIYTAFPADLRTAAEVKLKRASEFFASVVLTFVIRDLAQLLDKYAKKCEKWLAE